VSGVSVWKVLFGVEQHVVVEAVELEVGDDGQVVVVASVRPVRRRASRCGQCLRRCPGYDRGQGRRRWRGLDLGTTRVFLESEAPRVRCREHGVVVAGVAWARHDSPFTAAFEDQAAWLAAHATATTVAELMRSSWRAVTRMVARVVAEARGRTDRLAGVVKVAIDEKAYRKGHFSGDPRLSLGVSSGGCGRGLCRTLCLLCATWSTVKHAGSGEGSAGRADRDARVLDRCG
jgi:transposase